MISSAPKAGDTYLLSPGRTKVLNLTLPGNLNVAIWFKSFEETRRTVAWVKYDRCKQVRLWTGTSVCGNKDEWSDTIGEKVALSRALAKATNFLGRKDRTQIWNAYWDDAAPQAVNEYLYGAPEIPKPQPPDLTYYTEGTEKVLDALRDLSEAVAQGKRPSKGTLLIQVDVELRAGGVPRLLSSIKPKGVPRENTGEAYA